MTNAYYPFDLESEEVHLPQVLLKFSRQRMGETAAAVSPFFPFATRFLSSIHRTFLYIFVQYTQKYNEIKNIL